MSADSTYKGATAEGVMIGSTTEEITRKYGKPDNLLATSRGVYLVYGPDRMAFNVAETGEVIGWMIYGDG